MEKPIFPLYDIFIRIGLASEPSVERCISVIRSQVSPLISYLKEKRMINWYFFLIHNRESGGIPTTKDDRNAYYHIRFGLESNIDSETFLKSVEDYLEYKPLWRRTNDPVIHGGFDRSGFRNEQFEEAWKVMGEQSEWIINMIEVHKKNVNIAHIVQFMHYFLNMMGLGGKATLMRPDFSGFFRF